VRKENQPKNPLQNMKLSIGGWEWKKKEGTYKKEVSNKEGNKLTNTSSATERILERNSIIQ
jgi:hypothetical protein